MHFLPDIYVPCEVCRASVTTAKRWKSNIKARTSPKSWDDGGECNGFLQNIPKIHRKMQTLMDVGLGYITLGQPATTLSGGEAHAREAGFRLYRRGTGKTMYILDEPTTGLHVDDIDRLLVVLHRLVESGSPSSSSSIISMSLRPRTI